MEVDTSDSTTSDMVMPLVPSLMRKNSVYEDVEKHVFIVLVLLLFFFCVWHFVSKKREQLVVSY